MFEVRIEGWTNLKQRITDYSDVVAKYFADLAPTKILARLDFGIEATRAGGAETRNLIQQGHTTIMAMLERGNLSDGLHTRIVDAARLIEEGAVNAGLKVLERLWSNESSGATPRNRYLIRANIGLARLSLGDTLGAIPELRAAAVEDPTWPNARAILAHAELLEGNRERAFEISEAALREDPTAGLAATTMITAAADSTSIHELQERIPAALQQRVDVLLSLAYRAREIGDNAARHGLIERAASFSPRDWRVLAAQAELLLEPILEQKGLAFTHFVPAVRVPDLNRAIALLQGAWGEVQKRDNATVAIHVAANLLSALEVAGRATEYEQLLGQALNIAPTFQPLLRRYAGAMAAINDWGAAAKALNAIPSEFVQIRDRLFRIQASIHTGQASEAIAAARTLELEIGSGDDAEIAAGLQIEAAWKANCVDIVLPEILGRWPESIILRSLAHNLLSETDPRRPTLLDEIKALTQGIAEPVDRIHAADALYNAKQYSAAADMYDGLCYLDRDTPALYRTIASLLLSDRRKEARDLFDSLSSQLKKSLHYAELGSSIYEYAGLLAESRRLIEAALAQDDTLRRRVHWLSLSERMGDIEPIIRWLDSINPDLSGTPQELMYIALAIDRLQGNPRSFRLAYRALRAGYSDPSLHIAYMMQLVFTGRTQQRAFSRPTEVVPDTVVLMDEKEGARKLIRILETEPDPVIERNEIAPDVELGPSLIGLKVGDQIQVPSVGAEPTIYVIREIRDKFLHAHFRSLEQFETLFPGHQGFGSLRIEESKGTERFKPILDTARRRSEFVSQLTEAYRTGQLPLMMLSKYSGNSPCDAWEWVSARSELGLHVCLGLPEEFTAASRALESNPNAVIDPITLYALTRMGVAERVRACFKDLGVVQTSIDLFRRLLDDREKQRGKDGGWLGSEGEHLQMIRFDDAFADAQTEWARAALSFAETLTLVPAESSSVVTDNVRKFFEGADPCFLDTIYAAQGQNRLLYCDEYIFRQLATESGTLSGIWTQVAGFRATREKLISTEDYFDIVAALVTRNYNFTTIDFKSILHQLKKDQWRSTPALQAFVRQIASPANEPNSVVRLMADLAQAAWAVAPNRTFYVRFFANLIRTQRNGQSRRNAETNLDLVRNMVRARFRLTGYGKVLKRVLSGSTSLTPAVSILNSVTASADLAFQAIDQGLTEALATSASEGH